MFRLGSDTVGNPLRLLRLGDWMNLSALGIELESLGSLCCSTLLI